MYRIRLDDFDLDQWSEYCTRFTDMNIYQLGLYGQLHSQGMVRSCSRIVVLRDEYPVAAAQVRIIRIPFVQVGAAAIDWGPLRISERYHFDGQGLGCLLDAIKQEYGEKRNLTIRIIPRSAMDTDLDSQQEELLLKHDYRKSPDIRPYHSVVIDLSKSLDTIHSELHQKWRNQLNVAERAGLIPEFGNTPAHFERFYSIYKTMWKHKKFPTGVRLPIIRDLHSKLPEKDRFMITLIRDGKGDVGATVCSVMGDTMLYFLGATMPNLRIDSRPGYLLQWLHIQKAKELGMRWYDLGGYDDAIDTIARFKKRTNGLQLVYPGPYVLKDGHESTKCFYLLERVYRRCRRWATGR